MLIKQKKRCLFRHCSLTCKNARMRLRASVGNEVLEQVVGVVVSSVLLNVHLDDAFEIAAPANHSQVKKGDAEMGCLVACCIAIRDTNATNHRTSKLSGGDGVDVLAIH